MTRTKTYTLTATVVLASTLLAGCGTSEAPASPETAQTTTADTPAEPSEQASASAGAEAVEVGSAPSWATGVVTVGEPIGAVEVDGLSVELRYAGSQPATRTQDYTDGTRAFAEGDPIQYVSVTVTNPTSSTVEMGPGVVDVGLIPDGWAYIGAPAGEPSGTPYAALGLIQNAVETVQDSFAYPLAAGESFSFAVSTASTGPLSAEVTWRAPGGSETHEATTTVSVG